MKEPRNPDLALPLVLSVGASLVLGSVYLSERFPLPNFASEVLIAGLPLAGLVLSWTKVRGRRVPVPALITVCLYALVVLVSNLIRNDPRASLPTVLNPAILAVVMVVAGGLMTARELGVLARVLVGIGVAQALLAIAEVQLGSAWALSLASVRDRGYLVSENLIVDGMTRASGTMGHPILLGMVCSMAWVIVAAYGRGFRLILRLGLLALLTWGVLLSGSRSSVAALGFALVVYVLHRRTPIARHWRVVAALAVIPLTYVYLTSTLEEARRISPFSVSNRTAAVDRMIDTLNRTGIDSLIGEGHTFALETVIDNQFVTTAGRYGIVGLTLVIVACVIALSASRATVSALATVVVFMFLSFDVFGFSFPSVAFWLLVGIARSAASAPPCGHQSGEAAPATADVLPVRPPRTRTA